MPVTAHDILDFWFADTSAAHWFAADAAFDAQIRERFGGAMDAAADGRLDGAVAPAGPVSAQPVPR